LPKNYHYNKIKHSNSTWRIKNLKIMAKYIEKATLVAELEKMRSINSKNKLNLAAAFEDNYLLSFIETLEEKEVEQD